MCMTKLDLSLEMKALWEFSFFENHQKIGMNEYTTKIEII